MILLVNQGGRVQWFPTLHHEGHWSSPQFHFVEAAGARIGTALKAIVVDVQSQGSESDIVRRV